MKFIITGGAGFIGSHLTEYLLSLGHHVIVIDDLSTGKKTSLKSALSNKKLKLIIVNVAMYDELSSLIRTCDGVFHLAASVGVENIINYPLKSLKNSLSATESVLQAANLQKTPVVFTSSSEVYGLNSTLPFIETDPVLLGSPHKARWLYATEKLLSEHLALAYHKDSGLPIVIARLFNTIGPRQSAKYGMVVPRFITQALSDQPLTVYGDGTQRRCFTAVRDVVSALYSLMMTPSARGSIVNIGNNHSISINELADRIIDITQSKSIKKYITAENLHQEFAEMPNRVPDLTIAQKLIHFQPNTDLNGILREIITHSKSDN